MLLRRAEHLRVDVELELIAGIVADAHGPRAAIALEVIERLLPEARLAKDVVEDLRSEEHTSELQSRSDLVCRLLLEKKKKLKNKPNFLYNCEQHTSIDDDTNKHRLHLNNHACANDKHCTPPLATRTVHHSDDAQPES